MAELGVALSYHAYDPREFCVLTTENQNDAAYLNSVAWPFVASDGKTYDATSMVATQEGKRMSITMTFKRMTVFNNTSVTLKLNGQQVRIPIDLTEITNQLTGYKILIP